MSIVILVLVLGVMLLAWMAASLYRQMNGGERGIPGTPVPGIVVGIVYISLPSRHASKAIDWS
jgi:hypothetical protein